MENLSHENLSHENFTEKKITDIVDSLSQKFDNVSEVEKQNLINYCLFDLREISSQVNVEKKLIPNKGAIKATLLMSKLIIEAQKSIFMVLGSMDGKMSDNEIYLNSFKKALEKNLNIKIIFLNNPNTNSKLFNLLKNEKVENKNNLIILYNGFEQEKLKQKISNHFKNVNTDIHFSVFDDKNVRVEVFPNEYMGYAAINDFEYVGEIKRFFEKELIDGLKELNLN